MILSKFSSCYDTGVDRTAENLILAEVDQDAWSLLPSGRRSKALSICSFLLGEGRLSTDINATVNELRARLVDAGVPLDRYASVIRILHSTDVAIVRFWERGAGASDVTIPYKSARDDAWLTSPPAFAHQHGAWIAFNPHKISAERFGIVADLRQAGIHQYICAPVKLANAMEDSFSFATRSPDGFSAEDVTLLRAIFPALCAYQEIVLLQRMLKEVTRMYVGEEPHRRILSGDVHRGEVTRISSAIVMSDMREFTSLTADMTAEQTTALLNEYFDCIVPPIEAAGGEVLKFIGDGVLAIVRGEQDASGACKRALAAARDGLRAVATRNEAGSPRFRVGIALHYGSVAYGNIGSGMRLDYTVIGRDVNLASRIAGLCGTLNKELLASDSFRALADDGTFQTAGDYPLKGFQGATPVFEPGNDQ